MTNKEYQFYVEADRLMAGWPERNFKRRVKLFFFPEYLELFMLLLRKVEYGMDRKGFFQKVSYFITDRRFKKISLKLGFTIFPNVFGPGLYIPHYGTIVVNSNTKVGAHCVLQASTCIGGAEPKVLGDNLYISTGVIILGAITLADNITISAHSLVNKSFKNSNVLIGGIPAKELKERKTWFENEDHDRFALAVKQIEELRKSMFGGA
ncbi:MAG: hypothetical protein ACXVB0_08025 [Mucilaginibacter sp.]